MVIRSNRQRLILQAAVITLAAGAIGYGLQQWSFVESSVLGRIDDLVPGPLILMVVAGVGLWTAGAILLDSWSHRIVLDAESLELETRRGRIRIPYTEIRSAERIPAYGVGLGLRDFEGWMAEQPDAPATLEKEAELLRSAYGVEIGILDKNLGGGADRALSSIRERLGPRGEPAT